MRRSAHGVHFLCVHCAPNSHVCVGMHGRLGSCGTDKNGGACPTWGINTFSGLMLNIHVMTLFTYTDHVHKSNNPAVDYQSVINDM